MAELTVADCFSDHMVVQREQPIRVWGCAAPGDRVTVSLAGRSASTTADGQGDWLVRLQALPAGGPHTLRVRGSKTIELRDVLVGEVWLCSGQSNMQYPLRDAADAEKHLSHADHPKIRLLRVPNKTARLPGKHIGAAWQVCTVDSARRFSAVGYFFACRLQEALGVPVGMISSAYGGTVAEAWISREALTAARDLSAIPAAWERFIRDYPSTPRQRQAAARRNREALIAARKTPPPWPLEPKGPDHFHRPGSTFNAMIAPLVPLSLRGVLWYQGEANAWRAAQYRRLLPALMADWRRRFENPQMPWLLVQLPGFAADWLEEPLWAEMRESQAVIARQDTHAAMITAIDLGDRDNIHPRRKQGVGQRLALAALARVHGQKVPWQGPTFHRAQRQGNQMRIQFDHVKRGLKLQGRDLAGFTIAGADRKFLPAQARIDGKDVIVWGNYSGGITMTPAVNEG